MLKRLLMTTSAVSLLALSANSVAASAPLTDAQNLTGALVSSDGSAFTQAYVGDTYNLRYNLTNISGYNLPLGAATLSPPSSGFTQTSTTCTANITLSPGQSCYFAGTFKPTSAASYTWSASGYLGRRLPFTTTPQSISASAPIDLTLTSNFPSNTYVGSTYPVQLDLHNNTSNTVTLSAITTTPPEGFTATSASGNCAKGTAIAAVGSCSITGTYKPTTTTAHQWSVAFSIADQPTQTLTTSNTPTSLPSTIASNDIEKVVTGSDGTMYIATMGGLSISHDGGKTFTNITMQNGLTTNNVTSVAVSKEGIIFAGTDKGLDQSSDGGQTFTKVDDTAVNMQINDLMISTDTNDAGNPQNGGTEILYAATPSGLAYSSYDTDSKTFGAFKTMTHSSTFHYTIASDKVLSLAQDKHNNIIAGTDNGLSIASNDKILTDQQNIFNNIQSGFTINSIYITSAETIYASTQNNGYFTVLSDGSNMHKFTTDNGLPSNTVEGIATTPDGTTYVGTSQGFAYWTPGAAKFITVDPINATKAKGINTITLSADNSTIYVGLSGGGLAESTDGGKTFPTSIYTAGVATSHTNRVFVDSNHKDAKGEAQPRVYVATATGLSYSDDDGTTYTTVIAPFTNSTVVQAVYANNIDIYVGTYKGLYISHDGGKTFTESSDADLSGDTNVQAIAGSPTDSNTFYVGTSKQFLISHDKGTTFTKYQAKDLGLCTQGDTSDDFINVRSIYTTPTGRFYIATSSGISTQGTGPDAHLAFLSTPLTKDGSGNPESTACDSNADDAYGVYASDDGIPGTAIYAAAADQGLQVSTDSGNTFTHIDVGMGAATVNDIQFINNAYYASTDKGMTASNIGTNSWDSEQFKVIDDASISTNNIAVTGGLKFVSTQGGLLTFPA
jgi:ligand-binding sensor domain-containing protein